MAELLRFQYVQCGCRPPSWIGRRRISQFHGLWGHTSRVRTDLRDARTNCTTFVLHFKYLAAFCNEIGSKRIESKIYERISHFVLPVKLCVGWARCVSKKSDSVVGLIPGIHLRGNPYVPAAESQSPVKNVLTKLKVGLRLTAS